MVLETTGKAARDEKAVLGYYSGGVGSWESGLVKSSLAWRLGSIAANLASFDARTFHQPPDDWRPTVSADKTTWFEGSGDAADWRSHS